MSRHGHRAADVRNLELHRLAMQKLCERPDLVKACLDLIDVWLCREDLQASRRWLEQWRDMLSTWSIDRIAAVVLDEEGGQTLRQCSPLGPALTPRERWAVLDEVNRRLECEARRPPA
jgi:hypothetical protein